jgi:uracil-DNA glycosylase
MGEFDPGPPQAFDGHFDALPDYGPFRSHFWFDWGPVFYRGRLDGTARILCVASDPGPTERIAGRTLVGDAGQRVQGFLAKLGLTRSYLCLNAFAYALVPSHGFSVDPVLDDPDQLAWRNALFDLARAPSLVGVVAFGRLAREALDRWPGTAGLTVVEVAHPSSRDGTRLLSEWRAAVDLLRPVVTPDPDGTNTGPNYGAKFLERDYAPIPRRDLPFGVPAWLGDDAWGRAATPRHRNGVARPDPDDRHTLIWRAPAT